MIKNYWTAPCLSRKSIEKSIRVVCKAFNVTEDQIKFRCRKRIYNEPRAIISYLLRFEHNWTFQRIGDYFNRNHATILHHSNRVKNTMEVDKDYKQLVNSFK